MPPPPKNFPHPRPPCRDCPEMKEAQLAILTASLDKLNAEIAGNMWQLIDEASALDGDPEVGGDVGVAEEVEEGEIRG